MSEIYRQTPDVLATFAEQIERIHPAAPWALAVSGGSDSLALMHLASLWTSQNKVDRPIVLTVDHALRKGSADEAVQVKAWASALGLEHHTLQWASPKPKGDLQAAARQARYRLMGDFCTKRSIPSLLLAHSQDDQAETFLLRLARGSGLDGLSGMAPSANLPLHENIYDTVTLVRPLLNVSRDQLRSFLQSVDQGWIDDPSNADDSFARVQMRRLMPDLATHGLSAQRLAETSERLMEDRRFIEGQAAKLAADCLTVNGAGFIGLQAETLAAAPKVLALRVLGDALMAVGGGDYRPRAASLARLYNALRDGDDGGSRTLAGCHVERQEAHNQFLIAREWRSLSRKLAKHDQTIRIRPGQHVRWDHRLDLSLTVQGRDDQAPLFEGEIRPLGPRGWRILKELCREQGWPLPIVPARARATLPGLWVDDHLVSAIPLKKVRPSPAMAEAAAELRFSGRFSPDIQGFHGTV